MSITRLLIPLLVVITLVSSCEYDERLIGCYHLVRTNGYEVCIGRPSEPNKEVQEAVLSGNVRKLAVKDPLIVGYEDGYKMAAEQHPKIGYFIINVKTNSIQEEMSFELWQKELTHVGWKDPKLAPPP